MQTVELGKETVPSVKSGHTLGRHRSPEGDIHSISVQEHFQYSIYWQASPV